MLEAGLHIHDDHVVAAENKVRNDLFKHYMLRTDAAGTARFDRPHDEELYAVFFPSQHVGDIVHLWVDFKKFPKSLRPGPRTLGDKLSHLGYGQHAVQLFSRKAQRQAQVGVRVHVGGQHLASFLGIQPCKDRGNGGLPDAAFSRNCNFHMRSLFLTRRRSAAC